MSKPASSLGGILRLLKEAINLPRTDRKLILPIVLLLFPLNLVAKLNPVPLKVDLASLLPFRLTEPSDNPAKATNELRSLLELDLTGEALWWLCLTAGISSLSIAYITKPSTLAQVLRTLRRKWKRIAVTSFYASFSSTIYMSLLLVLSYSLGSSSPGENASLSLELIRLSAHLLTMVGGVVFVLVYLGCHLSVVVSSVEEGCFGIGALRRAGELVRRRKLLVLVLMSLLILLDQVPEALGLETDETEKGMAGWTIMARAFAKASLELIVMLFGSALYSVFYLESRREEKQCVLTQNYL